MRELGRKFLAVLHHWQSVLVCVYIFAIFSWTMPADNFPGKSTVDSVFRGPLLYFGLWQGWDMFAPNPRAEDIVVDVAFTNRDGSSHTWNLTQMNEMGFFDRWQRERWRKYFNDHLRLDSERNLWQPFADYAVRYLRTQGQDPVKMEFTRWWRPTVRPVSPDLRADRNKSPWNRYTFYRWSLSEELIR